MAPMTKVRLAEFSTAWAAKDIDALMAMMTDDCIYAASVGPEPGETFVGKAAVRDGFLRLLAHDAGGISRSGEVWIFGDRGYAEWSYAKRCADGSEYVVRGCDWFEFVGDKIRKKDAFRKAFA
jgi:ketosteroid isomerase-like protein